MVTRIYHHPKFDSDTAIAAFDQVIAQVREKGVAAAELEEVKVKFRSDFYSMLESGYGTSMPRFGLMHYLACFTLFDNDPQRINTILDDFQAVTPAQLKETAQKYLVPENRAVVLRVPTQKPELVTSEAGAR
jgi:predicted Zn-dependent peptidase